MNAARQNPYVGPRTFRTEERNLFFGRDREALDLLSLVISERLVLFYAQSGAGKSSLVNTKLIPGLQAEGDFEVLPIGRVKGDREGLEIKNIYVFNLISSLAQQNVDENALSKLSLCEFLLKLNINQNGDVRDESANEFAGDEVNLIKKYVLIIDQFEELFTTHLEAWEKREDFFRQLAQAMQEFPHLWIVLVMREDYIAYLDPYAQFLPGRLRVRYYMQRLEHAAALEAIKNPVKDIRPYADGVAEKLVENLASIKVPRPAGGYSVQAGQFIEPVQLQVVCYSLWEHLSEGTQITERDLQDVGDVDLALERYFDERVSSVAKTQNVSERRIREWFDKELITSSGTRDMVLANANGPGALNDNVIQAFLGDLVRAELRAGQIWYELSHDRLIAPVRKSNINWFEENLSRFQRQVVLWLQQGHSDGLLLRDEELDLAVREARALELTKDEEDFLESCEKLRRRERRDRLQRRIIFGALVTSVVLLLAAVFATARANQATRAAEQEAERSTTYAALYLARSQRLPLPFLITIEAYDRLKNYQTRGALLEIAQMYPHLRQLLFGHTDSVLTVAFSPDGKMLASGSKDHTIILWDVKDNKPVGAPLTGHDDSVHSLAFSPDGKILASGGDDHTIILWDMTSDLPSAQRLEGHKDAIYSVAFSPDGKMLASGSWDNTIILWDVATRQPIGKPLTGHTNYVYSVAFSPNGKILASGSLDNTVILWDVATGKQIGEPLKASENYVESVAFSPDGTLLASASFDGTVTLWDVAPLQNGENLEAVPKISSLRKHNNLVWGLAFSPDSQTLASSGADGTIILWDTMTHQMKDEPLRGHNGTVYDVAFSPDGTLASAGLDRSVILWDVVARPPIRQSLNVHQGRINTIAVSPDGKTFATGSDDKTFIFWDVVKRQPIGSPHLEAGFYVRAVTYSPDGKTLALGGYSTGVTLWDTSEGKSTRNLRVSRREQEYNYIYSLAFSPDGKTLASGNWQDTIVLWDPETLNQIGELKAHEPTSDAGRLAITSLAYSPDGKLLASASEDKTVILWDTATQQVVRKLEGHLGPVYAVAFSPDGKRLASASSDGSIFFWDTKTYKLIQQLSEHTSSVRTIAFNFDGTMLASGSADRSIILWDLASGQPIGQPLTGHTGSVYSLVFAQDGKTLISVGNEIVVWDLDPESWLAKSCRRAGRNLTFNEWVNYFPSSEHRATCPEWPLEAQVPVTATP